MTAAEYVAFELAADGRHEFHDGRVYAMSGASRAHDRIALNLASRLLAAARGGSCRVSMEGVRVVLPSGPHYYPDVMVACEPTPDDPHVETSPCPGPPGGPVTMTLDESYEGAEPPGVDVDASDPEPAAR